MQQAGSRTRKVQHLFRTAYCTKDQNRGMSSEMKTSARSATMQPCSCNRSSLGRVISTFSLRIKPRRYMAALPRDILPRKFAKLVEVIDVVLYPCGHYMLCRWCAQMVSDCPVCRYVITDVIRTYKAARMQSACSSLCGSLRCTWLL